MTSPTITGVDFVAVPTNDFDASVRFYGETLGLPFIGRYGDLPGAEFQAGNLTLAIMQPDAFGQEFRPNCLPIALHVDDVGVARAHLEAAGVEFVTETFELGCLPPDNLCEDPDGNSSDTARGHSRALARRRGPLPDASRVRSK